MDTIYDPIVGQITANLPAGVDLADDPTRAQVVDQVLASFGDGLPTSGSGNLTGSLDGNTSFLNGADSALTAPFLDGFANATVTVFWVSAIVVLIAFVLSFFLRAQPLRERSALQESLADQASEDLAIEAQLAASAAGAEVAPDFDDETRRDVDAAADAALDPEPARR
jgi:hypothetical protein